jgi:hypothetical protein
MVAKGKGGRGGRIREEGSAGSSTLAGNIEEKREDEDGDQPQKQVREKAPFVQIRSMARGSPLGAGPHRDLILVLEVPSEFACIVITVPGIAFHCPQDDFLQRWRDLWDNLPW